MFWSNVPAMTEYRSRRKFCDESMSKNSSTMVDSRPTWYFVFASVGLISAWRAADTAHVLWKRLRENAF